MRFIVVLVIGALAVGVTMIAARAAGALSGGGNPAATAVTYQVSRSAQQSTLAYWTPSRMLAAQGTAFSRVNSSNTVQPPKGIPTAVLFSGVPTAGALFSTTGKQVHFCTASVVDSTAGDMVLAAAHCVFGTKPATNVEYVPEYHSGQRPYGAWAVATITVAAAWASSHDPDLDFAFLTVSTPSGQKSKIQAVTGGLTPGFTLWYAQKNIEVIGYNDTQSEPVKCQTSSFKFRTNQMEFYCHGYNTGTSGGPWIIGYNPKSGTGTVFGVIGGYLQGGQYEWASYSSYFGHQFRVLFEDAQKIATPTPSPTPTPSGSPSASGSPSPTPTTT